MKIVSLLSLFAQSRWQLSNNNCQSPDLSWLKVPFPRSSGCIRTQLNCQKSPPSLVYWSRRQWAPMGHRQSSISISATWKAYLNRCTHNINAVINNLPAQLAQEAFPKLKVKCVHDFPNMHWNAKLHFYYQLTASICVWMERALAVLSKKMDILGIYKDSHVQRH